MDQREKLYRIAASQHIDIDRFALCKAEALAVSLGGSAAVAIDPSKIRSQADETVKLAHELGHCARGAFYSELTPLETRGRHEYRANVWAILRVVPFGALRAAMQAGCTELWQLAERFEVTEPFMRLAIEYYRDRRGFSLPAAEEE